MKKGSKLSYDIDPQMKLKRPIDSKSPVGRSELSFKPQKMAEHRSLEYKNSIGPEKSREEERTDPHQNKAAVRHEYGREEKITQVSRSRSKEKKDRLTLNLAKFTRKNKTTSTIPSIKARRRRLLTRYTSKSSFPHSSSQTSPSNPTLCTLSKKTVRFMRAKTSGSTTSSLLPTLAIGDQCFLMNSKASFPRKLWSMLTISQQCRLRERCSLLNTKRCSLLNAKGCSIVKL